jgi:uncharacterized protein
VQTSERYLHVTHHAALIYTSTLLGYLTSNVEGIYKTMEYQIKSHPIQTLVSGDMLHITSYSFDGSPGPRVYLQANLHGPEILGSMILLKLIDHLKTLDTICGSITIVPQANPIATMAQVYGQQVGRWNQQTGNNWNRIFKIDSKALNTKSIEGKLASTLMSLASNHDHVLDIHTSGKESVTHLYTTKESVSSFVSLNPGVSILYSNKHYFNAFDESVAVANNCVAATWEAGVHGEIDAGVLEKRVGDLMLWLKGLGVLDGDKVSPVSLRCVVTIDETITLYSNAPGYVVWNVDAGDVVEVGETVCETYNPSDGSIVLLIADKKMFVLSKYALQAVCVGQELGKMICL